MGTDTKRGERGQKQGGLEGSGVHVLIHLLNEHFLRPHFVPRGANSSSDAKRCAPEEITVQRDCQGSREKTVGPGKYDKGRLLR